jgi:hypothetical protein
LKRLTAENAENAGRRGEETDPENHPQITQIYAD